MFFRVRQHVLSDFDVFGRHRRQLLVERSLRDEIGLKGGVARLERRHDGLDGELLEDLAILEADIC